VQLAQEVQINLAQSRYRRPFAELTRNQQSGVTQAMQAALQGIDLSRPTVTLPQAVADAITTLRARIGPSLLTDNFVKGYSRAYSLDTASAARVIR
jgi:nitric oxide reductase subunit B